MPTNVVDIAVSSESKAEQNGVTIVLASLALCLGNLLLVFSSQTIAEAVQLTGQW